MSEPVSEREAEMFGAMLENAMDQWLKMTGRDEIPDDLARKVLEKMGDVEG